MYKAIEFFLAKLSLITFCFFLVSCGALPEGNDGKVGQTGEAGEQGEKGPSGDAGISISKIFQYQVSGAATSTTDISGNTQIYVEQIRLTKFSDDSGFVAVGLNVGGADSVSDSFFIKAEDSEQAFIFRFLDNQVARFKIDLSASTPTFKAAAASPYTLLDAKTDVSFTLSEVTE